MSLVYDENPVKSGHIVPYDRQNATKSYLTHYSNYLYLNFILKNSKDMKEQYQAGKELTICERKLAHWKRHANYNNETAMSGVADLKKKWNIS